MPDSRKHDRIGATPGKLALIAVLAVILVAAIILQFSGDATPANASSTIPQRDRRRPTRNVRRPNQPVAPSKITETLREVQWPRFSVDEVLVTDPFAPPESMRGVRALIQSGAAAPVASDNEFDLGRQAVLAEIRERKVRAIVSDGRRQAAWIGDQFVRVGDLIEGFRVTDIGTDGVTLVDEQSNPGIGN